MSTREDAPPVSGTPVVVSIEGTVTASVGGRTLKTPFAVSASRMALDQDTARAVWLAISEAWRRFYADFPSTDSELPPSFEFASPKKEPYLPDCLHKFDEHGAHPTFCVRCNEDCNPTTTGKDRYPFTRGLARVISVSDLADGDVLVKTEGVGARQHVSTHFRVSVASAPHVGDYVEVLVMPHHDESLVVVSV